MGLRIVPNERCIVVDDFLVIADLHIGYESSLKESGYSVPKMVTKFIKDILKLKDMTKTKKLIILGDVKHKIPRINIEEKYDVPTFFRKLSSEFEEIIVTKGNHDGYLEKMVHEENVKIVKEFIYKDYGFFHGHSYPSSAIEDCKIWLIAHTHPSLKLRDTLGIRHTYPCWIIGKINPKKLKKLEKAKVEKVIVFPAFNSLFVGYEKIAGPIAKAIRKEEVLLLDLTRVT